MSEDIDARLERRGASDDIVDALRNATRPEKAVSVGGEYDE